jgi:putative nucleotidyltransferase with HDIG domain
MRSLTKKSYDLVESACKAETNKWGDAAWTHHILNVIQFSKQLAQELQADEEIVELAAVFHDYASVLNPEYIENHHEHGARLARKFLMKNDYPEDRINQIEHCILSHRASKRIKRNTIEAKILASADAMAHFANLDSLFYLVYSTKKMGIDEGREYLLSKLDRSWKKLLPKAKDIIAPHYEAVKLLLRK